MGQIISSIVHDLFEELEKEFEEVKKEIKDIIQRVLGVGDSVKIVEEWLFGQDHHNVKVAAEINNVTNKPLNYHDCHLVKGYVKHEIPSVPVCHKEAFSVSKTMGSPTGVCGTASWKIGDTGKMVVIMWSAPYDFDFYSNWLAVGIFKEQDTKDFYERMYNGRQEGFARKEFLTNNDPLKYDGDDDYKLYATMTTTHKAQITVVFSPKSKDKLSPQIKEHAVELELRLGNPSS